LDSIAVLLNSLHLDATPGAPYRPVAEHIHYLFASGRKNYKRQPGIAALVAPELYERGRLAAMRLADDASSTVLLHGDLTPANVLIGKQGLVAIDPAPCVGDPAFDAVDLVAWRADDVKTITERVQKLAPSIGAEPKRLLAWCAAFAAMIALEKAEASPSDAAERVRPFVALANA
jgi:streptomycin 6-kinase